MEEVSGGGGKKEEESALILSALEEAKVGALSASRVLRVGICALEKSDGSLVT